MTDDETNFDLDRSLGIITGFPSEKHPSEDIRDMRQKYRIEIFRLRAQLAEKYIAAAKREAANNRRIAWLEAAFIAVLLALASWLLSSPGHSAEPPRYSAMAARALVEVQSSSHNKTSRRRSRKVQSSSHNKTSRRRGRVVRPGERINPYEGNGSVYGVIRRNRGW